MSLPTGQRRLPGVAGRVSGIAGGGARAMPAWCRGAGQVRPVDQPGQDAFAGQQDVEAVAQLGMPLHRLPVEHLVQQQLGFQIHLQLFAAVAQGAAQRVRAGGQPFAVECRLCRQYRKPLPQQLHGADAAAALAAGHVVQHDVAVDVGVFDQGHGLEAGFGALLGDRCGQALEVGQLCCQGVQVALGKTLGGVAQQPHLGIDIGLHLAVACFFSALEQGSFQLDHGQLQRRVQHFHRGQIDAFKQLAHARGRWRAGNTLQRLLGSA